MIINPSPSPTSPPEAPGSALRPRNKPRKLQVHLDQPTHDALFSEALRRSQEQRRSVSLAEVARELIERWVADVR